MTTCLLTLGFSNKDVVLYNKGRKKMIVYEVEKNRFNYNATLLNCILAVMYPIIKQSDKYDFNKQTVK
tara:strand:- start:372 stop:575 length:204 start_codon:yes stop_codon:yes gene_type:complete